MADYEWKFVDGSWVKVPVAVLTPSGVALVYFAIFSNTDAGLIFGAVLASVLIGFVSAVLPALVTMALGKGFGVPYVIAGLILSAVIFFGYAFPQAQAQIGGGHSSGVVATDSSPAALTDTLLSDATAAEIAVYSWCVDQPVGDMSREAADAVLKSNGIPAFGPYVAETGETITVKAHSEHMMVLTLSDGVSEWSSSRAYVVYLNHTLVWQSENSEYDGPRVCDYELSADGLDLTIHWDTGDVTYSASGQEAPQAA